MEILTPEDVGKEIGLSTRQILYYIDAKKLKAENMGRFWVITRADADAFIDWYRKVRPRPGRPPKDKPPE